MSVSTEPVLPQAQEEEEEEEVAENTCSSTGNALCYEEVN